MRSGIFPLRHHREADYPTQESSDCAKRNCDDRLAYARKTSESDSERKSSRNSKLKNGGCVSRKAVQATKHDATPNNNERSDRRFKTASSAMKNGRVIQLVRLKNRANVSVLR
jgi:hypothetical protein